MKKTEKALFMASSTVYLVLLPCFRSSGRLSNSALSIDSNSGIPIARPMLPSKRRLTPFTLI